MKKLLLTLMLSLAVSGVAQTDKPGERMIELKYLQGDRANRAIKFVNEVMGGRVRIVWEPVLRQLMIAGGSGDHMAQAEALLRKLDVPETRTPSKTLEFTIYLVGAYADATPVRGGPMPVELDSVVKEMRAAFAYQSLGLLDTIPVRVTEGQQTQYNGILPGGAVLSSIKHFYRVQIDHPQVQEDGKTVSTPGFAFTVEVPAESTGLKAGESGIRTDLTVRAGQKVVLGKIRLNDQANSAVFLVVTVKVL
jgi:hypothetical protein